MRYDVNPYIQTNSTATINMRELIFNMRASQFTDPLYYILCYFCDTKAKFHII